jgi:hypothetical protein
MDVELNQTEIRVLGSLIEKELTTPEYYPLSMNALVNACNQKSSRNPVMSLDENDVIRAVDTLRSKRLAWKLDTAGGRVPKYEHNFGVRWNFSPQEIAVLCVLLLRGPQTVGEIRNRTNRMYTFNGCDEVEAVLRGLMENSEGPFVRTLQRKPGTKEERYAHTFAAESEIEEPRSSESVVPETSVQNPEQTALESLRREIGGIRNDLDTLTQRFEQFIKQFD